MQLICKHCQSKLTLPDAKIPQGRPFAFNCPNCRQRIHVDVPVPTISENTRITPPPPPPSNPAVSVEQDGYNASEKPFDFVESGAKTALLCEIDATRMETVRRHLKDQGYYIREPASAIEALKLMRFHLFDLIVIHAAFDTTGAENVVSHYLARQSMAARRTVFVVLICPQLRTMDNMAAFQQSVNLIINEGNIADFGKILNRAMLDHADFYRVFRDVQTRSGKG